MSTSLRVLMVEDSKDDAILIMRALRRGGYQPAFERVDTPQAMSAALTKQDWDIVIADYSMPHFNGLAALNLLKETGTDLPFIIVSGTIGEDVAVSVMKSGAHDYVMKDKLARLGPAVRRELQEAQVRQARRQAEERLRIRERFLQCLAEVSQGLLRTKSVAQILPDVLNHLGETAQVSRVYLFENYLGATGELFCKQRYDWCAPGVELRIDDSWMQDFSYTVRGFARWIDVLGRDQVVAAKTADLPATEQIGLASQGVRSMLVIPLFVSDHWYGFIGFADYYQAREWQQVEIDLLRAVASNVANAIEREQTEHQSQALAEAAAVLTSTLDFEQVLDRILEQVGRVVPNDASNIMLVEGESARIVRWRGYQRFDAEEFVSTAVLKLSEMVNQRKMIETKEPVVVSDTTMFANWVTLPNLEWLRSHAAAPIIVREHVIGFLNVDSAIPCFFSPDHAKVLRTFADHTAAAIENARLFASEQQRTAALARALEQQRELDCLKSEFVQNFSHELRTPLALIRGYTELLQDGMLGELPSKLQEPVAVIARRSALLVKLVSDLTAILTTETQALELKPVDLTTLTESLLKDFEIVAKQFNLTLTAEIAPNVLIGGHQVYLGRVLDNILSNACKFTPAGGQVTVRLWQEQKTAVLEVADTGIGIPNDQLERIFERFYQVDGSTTRAYEGTGLGLALVKEIIHACGGQVSVKSQLEQGSTFRVFLPALNKE